MPGGSTSVRMAWCIHSLALRWLTSTCLQLHRNLLVFAEAWDTLPASHVRGAPGMSVSTSWLEQPHSLHETRVGDAAHALLLLRRVFQCLKVQITWQLSGCKALLFRLLIKKGWFLLLIPIIKTGKLGVKRQGWQQTQWWCFNMSRKTQKNPSPQDAPKVTWYSFSFSHF